MAPDSDPSDLSPLDACADFIVASPNRCALFLDMDGTLLDLAPTPIDVSVRAGLIQLLARLSEAFGGALAIITGRRIAEVDRLLAPLRLPASGVHGSELRQTETAPVKKMTPLLPRKIVDELTALAAEIPGVFAEPKGSGLAVHYRLATSAGTLIERKLREFLARHPGRFDICPGQKVFEVLPVGFSKGTALDELIASPRFHDRIPVMIGDDIGDEPAFAAARKLGGFALKVEGENYERSEADFTGTQHVYDWLSRLDKSLATRNAHTK